VIQTQALGFSYGRAPVLRGVGLEVRDGEILGVLGPNGCGKSTLLRLFRGLLEPTAGSVTWAGRPAHRLARREMARLAAVVPQSSTPSFPFPVREAVAMGRFARGLGLGGPSREDRRAVDLALALTDTLHLAERRVTELSGGEYQRVILARALAQEAPTLLLDEATSHLDLDHRLDVADLMVRLNRERGTTIVQVSHDLDLASETSHRLLLLDGEGAPVALGPPEEVLTPMNLRRAFRVEVRVEPNPFTGAPRVLPAPRPRAGDRVPVRVHLLAGGGSGADALRRLYAAGCRVTAGPLNRGDSDEVLARALGLEVALEEPFCAVSPPALEAARSLARGAAAVVAPTAWGPGNLACLDLAFQALDRGQPVFLLDPRADRDFTGGRAWDRLQGLLGRGARSLPDAEALVAALEDRPAGSRP